MELPLSRFLGLCARDTRDSRGDLIHVHTRVVDFSSRAVVVGPIGAQSERIYFLRPKLLEQKTVLLLLVLRSNLLEYARRIIIREKAPFGLEARRLDRDGSCDRTERRETQKCNRAREKTKIHTHRKIASTAVILELSFGRGNTGAFRRKTA